MDQTSPLLVTVATGPISSSTGGTISIWVRGTLQRAQSVQSARVLLFGAALKHPQSQPIVNTASGRLR